MWEFYLASSEMAFRDGDRSYSKFSSPSAGDTPVTRDYIAEEEVRLRGREVSQTQPLRLAGE